MGKIYFVCILMLFSMSAAAATRCKHLFIPETTMLGGVTIQDLEVAMKNSRPYYIGSNLLGPQEKLIPLLINDQDKVTNLGITAAQIGKALRLLLEANPDYNRLAVGQHVWEYKSADIKYLVRCIRFAGGAKSVFRDNLTSKDTIVITNLNTNQSITFGDIQIPFIERYGFYEGVEIAFRLDPSRIVEVLPFVLKLNASDYGLQKWPALPSDPWWSENFK
jgi:hypothetical protein